MKIWIIKSKDKCLNDIECAWTKKEDAINYLEEVAKSCNWEIKFIHGAKKEINETLIYLFTYKQFLFEFSIYSIFLDENPYF